MRFKGTDGQGQGIYQTGRGRAQERQLARHPQGRHEGHRPAPRAPGGTGGQAPPFGSAAAERLCRIAVRRFQVRRGRRQAGVGAVAGALRHRRRGRCTETPRLCPLAEDGLPDGAGVLRNGPKEGQRGQGPQARRADHDRTGQLVQLNERFREGQDVLSPGRGDHERGEGSQ